MWSWAKVIAGILGLFKALADFLEEQRLIAQGKAQEQARQRELEDERVSKAARARDDIVTDGVQPVDVKRAPPVDTDPYNRDTWGDGKL